MLTIGMPAPTFAAFDQHGQLRRLREFRGKWLLLYFYPFDNTPGCVAQACALRDNFAALERYVDVVGVSTDSVRTHAKFAERHNLPFTLLADPDRDITKAYGTQGLFFPKRTSFLIDPEGIIGKVYEKVRPNQHIEDLLTDFADLVETIDERAQAGVV